MENDLLLDTSILIQSQRGYSEIRELLVKYAKRICTSRIVACEIILGSRDKLELASNKELLERIPIIDIDKEISRKTFYFIEKYTLKHKLYVADALILATAFVRKAKLWTLDLKHFATIKEIELFKE